MRNGVWKYFLISLTVIAVDQVVKLVVYNNMTMGPSGEIMVLGDWFKLHYLTNDGMAFGLELPFKYSKVVLTVFRIIAMVAIAYYLSFLFKKSAPKGLMVCVGFILGGAIGNLIDSIFYGVFLDLSAYDAPMQLFHGKVIDMFYIDIWEGYLPDWLGGRYMALWPVFNIADASIFCSIIVILIFQKRYFKKPEETVEAVPSEE